MSITTEKLISHYLSYVSHGELSGVKKTTPRKTQVTARRTKSVEGS